MKKKFCFTDAVLVLLGIGTAVFIYWVLRIFREIGSEPSTLVAGFFAFVTAEAAICWQIYAHKHKIRLKTDELENLDLDIDGDPNEPDEENEKGEG